MRRVQSRTGRTHRWRTDDSKVWVLGGIQQVSMGANLEFVRPIMSCQYVRLMPQWMYIVDRSVEKLELGPVCPSVLLVVSVDFSIRGPTREIGCISSRSHEMYVGGLCGKRGLSTRCLWPFNVCVLVFVIRTIEASINDLGVVELPFHASSIHNKMGPGSL